MSINTAVARALSVLSAPLVRASAPSARPFPGVAVSALETRGLRDEGALLIDVREPREWSAGHIKGSRNIPLDVIAPGFLPEGLPVVLLCRNGNRAALAARILGTLGVPSHAIFVLHGGLQSWRQTSLPLVSRDESVGHLS